MLVNKIVRAIKIRLQVMACSPPAYLPPCALISTADSTKLARSLGRSISLKRYGDLCPNAWKAACMRLPGAEGIIQRQCEKIEHTGSDSFSAQFPCKYNDVQPTLVGSKEEEMQ